VRSWTWAVGAFVFTDSMPFCAQALELYASLGAMSSPLPASNRNRNFPGGVLLQLELACHRIVPPGRDRRRASLHAGRSPGATPRWPARRIVRWATWQGTVAELTVMTWNVQNLFPAGTEFGPATQQDHDDKIAALAGLSTRSSQTSRRSRR
jgi:hypothetical protein